VNAAEIVVKKNRKPSENTARVIAVALAVLAALGLVVPGDELPVLGSFAAAFALLTYVLDGNVRTAVNGAIAGLRDRSARRDRTRGRPAHIRT
jgi:hypothetical protein